MGKISSSKTGNYGLWAKQKLRYMKVTIDTDKKTLKVIGLTTIPELIEFIEKYGFVDYILLASDDVKYDSIQPSSSTPN